MTTTTEHVRVNTPTFDSPVTLVEPAVTKVRGGTPTQIRSRYGDVRTEEIGKQFEVTFVHPVTGDTESLGLVTFRMITRETRSKGKRYVNARWQSPGWVRQSDSSAYSFDSPSKVAGVNSLVRDYNSRSRSEANVNYFAVREDS